MKPETDSRLKGYIKHETHPVLPLERTYCTFCGQPKGWVSNESYGSISPAEVIVVCDACHEQHGQLPLPEIELEEYLL